MTHIEEQKLILSMKVDICRLQDAKKEVKKCKALFQKETIIDAIDTEINYLTNYINILAI